MKQNYRLLSCKLNFTNLSKEIITENNVYGGEKIKKHLHKNIYPYMFYIFDKYYIWINKLLIINNINLIIHFKKEIIYFKNYSNLK